MSQIGIESIKELRTLTGAGIMDCRRALEEVGGQIDRAVELLREKGIAKAGNKAGRETLEGKVESYVHSGNRNGAKVELNCETDYVARTPEFRELAHDLAMQVAAMSPKYVDRAEAEEKNAGEPDPACLLEQEFIKDSAKTIQDLINDTVARVGENIKVRRFERFALGE